MVSRKESTDGSTPDQVLAEEKGFARILTLNRPRRLNALSAAMIQELLRLLPMYEDDNKVKLLIMKGKGRAFCAGGDVAAVARSVTEGHWTEGAKFFWDELIVNYIIATYRKPQVSILNGIVMGGGAGVSIHGRFRVATENSVFAMPETALGLFPELGASFFLSRLPGYFGEFVGLTGVRLDGAEMLACGLATHFVISSKLPVLEESLVKVDTSDSFAVCAIIDQFSQQVPLKKFLMAFAKLEIINKCFSKRTVEEIISALEQEAVTETGQWIRDAIQSLKKASPTSLKISLRSIREGRLQSVGELLVRQHRMVCHVLRREFSNDFFEGCRAILADKDRNPKWEPSRLDLVDDQMVDQYFSKVDGWEDLKLPIRDGTAVSLLSKLVY